MIVLTSPVSHAAPCAAVTARRGEALPEWAPGKITPRAGVGAGAGMKPRASPPGGSGAGHEFRSAQIKPFTAAERRDPAAARQNAPVGQGANVSRRFAPPALKYNCSERALSQMPRKKKSSSPDRLIPSQVTAT